MKKLLCLYITIILFCCSSAFCETIDYTTMTNEELQLLINKARNELISRNSQKEYIIDDNYIRIYKTGQYLTGYYQMDESLIENYVQVEIVIENRTDISFELIMDRVSINGWETNPIASNSGAIGAGMKKKYVFEMIYTQANLSDYRDIEDAVFFFHIGDYFDSLQEYKTNMVFNKQ